MWLRRGTVIILFSSLVIDEVGLCSRDDLFDDDYQALDPVLAWKRMYSKDEPTLLLLIYFSSSVTLLRKVFSRP